jgi:hypothetical protein
MVYSRFKAKVNTKESHVIQSLHHYNSAPHTNLLNPITLYTYIHAKAMSAVASPPAPATESGPSSLTPLSDLIRKSAKRTRAVYGHEGDGIDDGLGQA